MMPTLVGQVPDDDLYTADDIDDETDLEDNNEFKIYKRAASADVVRGQMFDVIFQGKGVWNVVQGSPYLFTPLLIFFKF